MANSRRRRRNPLHRRFLVHSKGEAFGHPTRSQIGKAIRMVKIRQIAYDQTFLDQAALLQKDAPRLDEMLDGVLWEIATHAEDCEIVERTLRVAFTDAFPDAPAMRIFF